MQHLSGHVAGIGARQEDEAGGDFVRLSRSPSGTFGSVGHVTVPCQVVENRKSTPDSGRCCSNIGAAARFTKGMEAKDERPEDPQSKSFQEKDRPKSDQPPADKPEGHISSMDEGNERAAGRDDRAFDPNVNQRPPR